MHADNILVFIFCGKVNSLNQQIAAQKRDMNEYSGWATDELSAANMGIDEAQRKRKANLEELRGIDEQLGNVERPYDERQRAGYTVGGALKNTGASIVEAGTTFADLMSKYNSQNPYLTETEIQIANAMNMTPDEYLKMRQRGGTEEARQRAFGKYYDTADRLMQESAHDIEVAKADLGKLGQAGVDLSVNLVQMGADAAGRAIGFGMLPFFTRAAGGSAYEARQEGATLEQRAAYGALKGAIEVGTEKLFDGVAGIFGKGTADKVVENAVRKLTQSDKGRTALRALAGAAGEGSEEVISDLLDPFAKLVYNNQALKEAWENRDELASDMLYDYLIGFAMGGLGAGGSIATGQDAAKNKAARKADSESYELFAEQQAALDDIRAKFFGRLPDQADYMLGYATLDELNAADKARAQEAVQKNTAPESGTVDSTIEIAKGPSALSADTRGAANLLARNIGQIENNVPVAALSGREMQNSGKKVSEQISDFFKRIGGQVDRPGLGSVEFGKYSLGSILNHRPLNRAKLVSLTAVPEVISEGKIISDVGNWKGRGYRSIVFAAPVTIAGDKVYVAAIVNQFPDSNKFYLNECVDTEGNYIRINEIPSNNTKTGLTAADGITGGSEEISPFVTVPDGTAGEAVASPNTSIPISGQNVNNQFADNPAVNDPAGYLLGYYNEEQMRENAAKAREAAERAKAGNEGEYADLAGQYGTIPAGEKPFRESAMPQSTIGTDRVGRTARTIYEAEATPEARLGDIRQAVVDGKFSYIPIKNKDLESKARKSIEYNGWQSSLMNWTAEVRSGKSNPRLVAIGATLLNNAGSSGMTAEQYIDLAMDYDTSAIRWNFMLL